MDRFKVRGFLTFVWTFEDRIFKRSKLVTFQRSRGLFELFFIFRAFFSRFKLVALFLRSRYFLFFRHQEPLFLFSWCDFQDQPKLLKINLSLYQSSISRSSLTFYFSRFRFLNLGPLFITNHFFRSRALYFLITQSHPHSPLKKLRLPHPLSNSITPL